MSPECVHTESPKWKAKCKAPDHRNGLIVYADILKKDLFRLFTTSQNWLWTEKAGSIYSCRRHHRVWMAKVKVGHINVCEYSNQFCKSDHILWTYYSLITFNEKVTVWLQCTRSPPCACVSAGVYAGVIA